MAVVATDAFTRANGPIGANWTANGGYTIPSIVSNAVPSSNGNDLGATYTAADAGQDDMYAKISATVGTAHDANDLMVWVRMPNSTAETGYEVNAPRYGFGAGRLWELQRASAGVYTQLAISASGSPLSAGTRTLELRAVGTTLTALQDGATLASVTDSTHSGSTKRCGGIHLYSEAGGGCSLDNFEMGTVVATSAPAVPDVVRSAARMTAATW